ncbi:hypothetical protein Aduo_015076 [Ancylostoma duodenale]
MTNQQPPNSVLNEKEIQQTSSLVSEADENATADEPNMATNGCAPNLQGTAICLFELAAASASNENENLLRIWENCPIHTK